jgi:uncharacterized protein DUF2817
MNLFIKGFLILLTVIIVSGLIFSYAAFNCSSFDDSKFKVVESNLKYFKETYSDSRAEFIKSAVSLKGKYKNVILTKIPVPSKKEKDLTIDCLYIPARKSNKNLIIIVSGTHGIEGFTGSAVERMFMNEIVNDKILENMGIVVIHGMNPYGFKVVRRVTENNVDLNRNSDVNKKLFETKNTGYVKLNEFLNPAQKVDVASLGNKFYILTAIQKILTASMKTLRQAILQGQYTLDKGIYFGGKKFEPQIISIKKYFVPLLKKYSSVMSIDLHTGFGERGVAHLFPNPIKDPKVKVSLKKIFAGYHIIDSGSSDDFYTVHGSFVDFIGLINPNIFYLPMLIEYGTLNSQTTVGSIKSLHTSIIENQGFYYGYETAEDEKEVKKRYREMFYPSSKGWRSTVIEKSRKLLKSAVENYSKL